MADDPLKMLEGKVDQLIALCAELNRENQQLKAENEQHQRERQHLMERNEMASSKVEAMIDRLRSME